jgi:tRNA A37 threonylcarbamoyladenosine dehydratase
MADLKWLSRTALLVGNDKVEALQNARVLVVGLGGVGSFAAEFIARAGVGNMTILDGDVVDPSNRNRQLPALSSTHGLYKTEVMEKRLLDINPDLNLVVKREFLIPEHIEQLLNEGFDYVVDAIDSITPKCHLIATCKFRGIPLVSSMGAGGKLDPTKIQVSDISKTRVCYLASCVRKRLRHLGVYQGVKAVSSTERVIPESLMLTDGTNFKKSAYGTISYLPAAFGGVIASVVITDLVKWKGEGKHPSAEHRAAFRERVKTRKSRQSEG